MRLREKFARLMAGRYGTDQLNKAMCIAALVCFLPALVFRRSNFAALLWFIGLVLLVLIYVRAFSKNIARRVSENNRYMRFVYDFNGFFKMTKERWVQRRDYKFFRCPSCRTTLRVPRGKGKINIVCRKCGNSFRGKT